MREGRPPRVGRPSAPSIADQAVQVARRPGASRRPAARHRTWSGRSTATARLWILQARPMTALPPDVSWASPAPGAYTRQLRFGEWICEPVTPLFESWLLREWRTACTPGSWRRSGSAPRRPLHVVVNGWYFYSLNWISPRHRCRQPARILAHLVRTPRTCRRACSRRRSGTRSRLMEREWRTETCSPGIAPRSRRPRLGSRSLPVGGVAGADR